MIDVLLTSVSPLALMAGKILALGTTSLVQMSVWIASIAIIGPQIVDQIPNAGDLKFEPLTLRRRVLSPRSSPFPRASRSGCRA